ncbi:DUF4261 domain-containing protein [Mucilaginibacter sp. OK098]|uniref:DUF4261 domain-containing protein n=1 Tax=Mucilaginibacter sp. OK098 TaxID=1855297 RepID=UPI00091D492D|nr:DUF4261 domain-containing protein [Mucilaginibacter sp. OK098]SHN17724.1 protein of unknown function [Mucilaginibacter sp. OK098]
MALFDFLKKDRKKKESKQSNILLAMPIFKSGDSYQLDKVIDNIETFWNLTVTDIEGDDKAASFTISGESIAIANMPVEIPWGDIEGTAQYAYNWPSALKDLEVHTGHAIVSIMASQKSPIERFKILSKVLGSILLTSNAIAIYQGTQSLLIPRNQYLDHIEELKENGSPVALWIYIGLRKLSTGNCAYTYGLKEFEKNEIEIVDSKLSLEELFDFIFNITSYIISSDVTLKSGETIGLTAEQKIPIKLSKGEFVERQSFKLEI